jgi:hypothetical protein
VRQQRELTFTLPKNSVFSAPPQGGLEPVLTNAAQRTNGRFGGV